jgi:hypothetical protein
MNIINKKIYGTETNGTLDKKIRWTNKHDIFDVIFEKESRKQYINILAK